MPFHRITPGFLGNRELLMMMGCTLVMFSILTSSMVVQLTSMSPYAAPLSLLLSPPVLHVLGWLLLLLERLPRMKSIWQLWRRWGQISFQTFGVWTPFALKNLQNIADRTTPHSGVPWKVARKNLLQQLSVQLWSNNAKMILRYLHALQGLDDDDNPLFP